MAPREHHPGRRLHARDGDRGMGALVGPQLEHGIAQREPASVHGQRRRVAQQAHHHVERLGHHRPQAVGVDPQHARVREVPAGPDAEVDAPAREVVELHDPVGNHQGVVVGEAHHAGPQPDVAGALGRHRQEDLGGGDRLPAGAVVLPHPGLVEAQLVQPHDQLEIAFQGEGGVLSGLVVRRHEDAEAHPHRPSLFGARRAPGHTPRREARDPLAAVGLLALGAATAIGPPLPGAPACRVLPASNVWNRPVDALPVLPGSDGLIRSIGLGAALHPDFSNQGRYGIPINIVRRITPRRGCASPMPRSRTGSVPDPGQAPHRGRQRPSSPPGRSGRVPPVRAVRRPPRRRRSLDGGVRGRVRPRLQPPAPGRMDQRGCGRPPDPAGPRPLGRGRGAAHRPRPALHGPRHPAGLRVPGPPRRRPTRPIPRCRRWACACA